MDRAAIVKNIGEVFEDVMDVDPAEVTEASSGDTIEGWDSLSHVRLIVAVERKFGLRFSNAEIEGLASVGDLVDLIISKTAANAKA